MVVLGGEASERKAEMSAPPHWVSEVEVWGPEEPHSPLFQEGTSEKFHVC